MTAPNWIQHPGAANDIGIGANGAVWVIGTNTLTGGYGIYHWNSSNWDAIDGAGVRIAVDQNGNPWVINNANNIYQRVGNAWHQQPGAAHDIGIGANGAVWIIGTNTLTGGYGIYQWNGSNWDTIDGAGANIAVDPNGLPWMTNTASNIYQLTSGPQQATHPDRLTTGQWIAPDAPLISADGRYAAYLQDDANLVLCSTKNGAADLSRPYWSAFANAVGQVRGSYPGPHFYAIMQSDGNFVLYNGSSPASQGPPYWATNTNRAQSQYTAIMQNDGNFVIYDASSKPIWATNTWWVSRQITTIGSDRLNSSQTTPSISNDSALISADGKYAAVLRGDGNLVLCHTANSLPDFSQTYWSALSSGQIQVRFPPTGPPFCAIMQNDGNFVVYDGTSPASQGLPYWATNTSRSQNQFTAIMQNDGNFVIYQGTSTGSNPGTAVWASNTVTGQGLNLNIVSGNNQSIPCQLEVDGIWYDASFQPFKVRLTDSVLNPIAGQEVEWVFSQGVLANQSEVVLDGQALLNPSDYDFPYSSTSDTNGMTSMSVLVRMPSLPLAERPISFTVTVSSGGRAVTFSLSTTGTIIGGVSTGPWS